MRKYFMLAFLALVVLVMFIGCEGKTSTTPATTPASTPAPTVVDELQGTICNATPETIAIADMVINLLKPELVALVPASAPFVAYVTAQNMKTTGCAAVTGVNTMIAFIQGYNTKTMLAYKSSKAKGPMPELIPVAPLTAWLTTAKKLKS